MINITLDFPPTMNHMYIKTMRGMVLTEEARKYKRIAYGIARDACRDIEEYPEVWAFTWMVYLPDARARDLDNLLKVPQDAVCGGLGINDNLITHITIIKAGLDRENPRLELHIAASEYNPYAKPAKKTRATRARHAA